MKILMVSHEYPPIGGGGANACMNLAHEYRGLGHDITIVTAWFPGQKERSRQEGLTVIRLKSRRRYKEHCSFGEMLSYLGMALPCAAGLHKKEQFDVAMVFFAIPSGPIGYYLKKRYGLPYIIRFGGGDIPGFQERFTFVYKLLGPFEKAIWRNADALVANSRGLRELAEKFDRKKEIKIIPNGVDIDFFREASGEKTEKIDCFRLLFVSRLIERKGLQFVIPQLAALRDACGGNVKLTIVGDGPYRRKLEEIAADCGVSDCILFAGQKDKAELAHYYQTADVFILPSKKEGMPNVVLEAMASSLPVVMTPCEGSEELIDGNGYVAKAEQFGEKLTRLAADRESREAMGRRSAELVRERFLWRSVAKRYERILEAVAAKR